MKIERIKIDGFKNLSNANITFERLTAIVSLNNFGKSNYLKGIDFGISFIKANINSKLLMLNLKNDFPFNKSNFGKNFYFEIETNTDINNKNYNVTYSFEASWKYKETDNPKIISESLKIKENNKKRDITLIDRKIDECLYKASSTGRCATKLKTDDLELAINKLEAFDNLFYSSLIKEINETNLFMENTSYATSMYNQNPISIKETGSIEFTIQNLPKVLFKLKELNNDKYELIENTFILLFPEITELNINEIKINSTNAKFPDDSSITISDSIYLLSVKNKNLVTTLSFEEMSDGAKKILVLLTRIILAEMNNVSLIVIEEPENSIHPSLLNSYIQVIAQLLNNSKIVFTSHSPYIISYLSNECIYAGLSDGEGGAIFRKVKTKKLSKYANQVDTLMGDYLFSLLAEESSEFRLIDDILED